MPFTTGNPGVDCSDPLLSPGCRCALQGMAWTVVIPDLSLQSCQKQVGGRPRIVWSLAQVCAKMQLQAGTKPRTRSIAVCWTLVSLHESPGGIVLPAASYFEASRNFQEPRNLKPRVCTRSVPFCLVHFGLQSVSNSACQSIFAQLTLVTQL